MIENDAFANSDIFCIFAITHKVWVRRRFTAGILNFLPRCLFSEFSSQIPVFPFFPHNSAVFPVTADWTRDYGIEEEKGKCSFSDENWHLNQILIIDSGQNINQKFHPTNDFTHDYMFNCTH